MQKRENLKSLPVNDRLPFDIGAKEADLVPRPGRGMIRREPVIYGRSTLETPLLFWPRERSSSRDVLILASIHGDEAETIIILSEALRSVPYGHLAADVILAANPDGLMSGTRGNARGVDLNRNFPTSDWTGAGAVYRWGRDTPRDVRLGSGDNPASESEVQSLIKLIMQRNPAEMIALHSPLACIDNPSHSPMGQWLSKVTGLPLVDSVGYPTPGSLGAWATETGRLLSTYEFGRHLLTDQRELHYPVLVQVLLGRWGR